MAALDAAAKNMSSYIRTYGGFSTKDPYKVRSAYEKALQAYNAGPGSVGKYLPAETKNYISKIVGPDKFSFTQALQNAAFTEPTSDSLPASSTVEPVSLPRYDIKKALEGIVGNFISKGLQPNNQNQDLSSQYLEKASELDDLGTPEAMELAEAYRLKAIESTATVESSIPDVASLYSGILNEKLKQIAYGIVTGKRSFF